MDIPDQHSRRQRNLQLEIKLDPHIGKQMTSVGPVDVDLGQYLVMAQTEHTGYRWVHLGYVCKPCATNPTPPFNGLDSFRVLPQSIKDEVAAKVQDLLGLGHMRVTEIAEPIEVEEAIDDDDDVDA